MRCFYFRHLRDGKSRDVFTPKKLNSYASVDYLESDSAPSLVYRLRHSAQAGYHIIGVGAILARPYLTDG
jgi:hypothetical protein